MPTFDVLIHGGRLIDGTGNPWCYADVALRGEWVAAVEPQGRIDPGRAARTVDATGMLVCPGFIDIQSHSILPLMIDGRSLSKITQGVTTEIMGEVWTPAPYGGKIDDPLRLAPFPQRAPDWEPRIREWVRFGNWLEAMMDQGVSPNIGSYLSGGTLRLYAKGMAMGTATAAELETMRRLTREAMEDGAFGLAYALIYPPEAYVQTDEIVELCKVAAEYGGSYITHVRSEAGRLIEGIAEAIDIGRQSGIPVEIYHLKATGKPNWHKMPQVIEMINAARAEGLDVAANMYPYTAAGTALTVLLPTWAAADGRLFERLADPGERARIREAIFGPNGSYAELAPRVEGAVPVSLRRPEHQAYIGRPLSDIATERGQDWLDATCDLLLAEGHSISTIYHMMSEDNLRLQLQQPWIKVSTDAGGLDPAWATENGPTHPRAYGTYPRVLGHFVREENIISLEEAIRKMSGAVAARLGLADRGILRPGAYADVVILDPERIIDHATYTDSHRLSSGVRDVWVNGIQVLHDGAHTGALAGRVVGR